MSSGDSRTQHFAAVGSTMAGTHAVDQLQLSIWQVLPSLNLLWICFPANVFATCRSCAYTTRGRVLGGRFASRMSQKSHSIIDNRGEAIRCAFGRSCRRNGGRTQVSQEVPTKVLSTSANFSWLFVLGIQPDFGQRQWMAVSSLGTCYDWVAYGPRQCLTVSIGTCYDWVADTASASPMCRLR